MAKIAGAEVLPMLLASKNCSETLRRERVRQLFQARLSEELTETGVLLFYWWLKKYHPELLPREKHDDPYQHLRVDLAGLYR